MPELVASNIDWEATLKDKKLAGNAKKLKRAMSKYGVADYTIVEKGDAKVAVFGLMGEEAVVDTPQSGVKWTNYIERAKKIVEEIKRNGEADYIIPESAKPMRKYNDFIPDNLLKKQYVDRYTDIEKMKEKMRKYPYEN